MGQKQHWWKAARHWKKNVASSGSSPLLKRKIYILFSKSKIRNPPCEAPYKNSEVSDQFQTTVSPMLNFVSVRTGIIDISCKNSYVTAATLKETVFSKMQVKASSSTTPKPAATYGRIQHSQKFRSRASRFSVTSPSWFRLLKGFPLPPQADIPQNSNGKLPSASLRHIPEAGIPSKRFC